MPRMPAGIREEEVCQILNLKKNLEYSEILVQYATKYQRLGWNLVAVNFKGEPALDLDFSQSHELWAEQLTGLGLEGIQVNLGVRTGALSRLLVLEVHRGESLAPFNQRGEWCSGCVAEVGLEREQHYYALPKGWQPPASFFLEAFRVMVFGEGGMVLAPPSLEPRARSNLRWLRPPWESPPTRPGAALCKFIKEHAPTLPQASLKPESPVTPWAEIYPIISSHPGVLQALLAPAPTSESYYQNLLKTAQLAGLEEPQFLLGLLWHAPLGNSHNHPQRAEYLMALVKRVLVETADPPLWEPAPICGAGPVMTSPEAPRAPAQEGAGAYPEALPKGCTAELQFGSYSPAAASMPAERFETAPGKPANGKDALRPGWGDLSEAWSEMCRFTQENLVVERRRYEAMIYELGKLGALNDIFKREYRQNKGLRDKLEFQWTKEIDYLRELVAKKTKKGWYRSWRQE
jgi:hypothetical protein